MKKIFDQAVQEELIVRINSLADTNKGQWGKMNVYQMVRHNTYWNEWMLGQGHHSYKQALIGKLFGKMALRKMIKDEQPFDKNVPTSAQFKIKETKADLEAEKLKWVALIKAYDTYENPGFIHDFFGIMNRDEIGILAYKHSDHHLRQFGV